MKNRRKFFKHTPESLILYSFSLVALIGAVFLRLPVSSATGSPLSWINALFMAVSAVCVTGLSVVDIGRDMTFFGQVVILFLIQLGGLGIMTFSFLFLILIGRKISLSVKLCIPDLTQDINLRNIKYSLLLVLAMSLTIESAGAVMLFLDLRTVHSLPFAAYSAVFHSISAFCNAGFSLYGNSFVGFNHNIYVLLTLMFLIILGGLGFIVIYEVLNVLTQKRKKVGKVYISLHTKIALTGSFCLIFFGAGLAWLLEHKGAFRGMPGAIQVLNAFFLSVTSRTAGFNTVETSILSNPTLLFIMLFMFIGGCPGSTAGGIKIHTFVSLCTLVVNKFKGLSMAGIFNRKIPDSVIERALTIFIFSLLIIFVAVFLLQLTENIEIPHSLVSGRERFLDTFFEAISAFGTVGLSTGTTLVLPFAGKVVIIVLMFVGRVGLVTLGVAMQLRRKKNIVYEFPQEDIMVS